MAFSWGKLGDAAANLIPDAVNFISSKLVALTGDDPAPATTASQIVDAPPGTSKSSLTPGPAAMPKLGYEKALSGKLGRTPGGGKKRK